jgi:hypothetical protein
MMNRVFSPPPPIDLETAAPALSPMAQPAVPPRVPSPRAARPPKRQAKGADLTALALAVLGGFGLAGVLGSLLLARQWAGLQNSLSHERNLLMVERLRTLGPSAAVSGGAQASPTPPPPVLDPLPSVAPRNPPATQGLPPPPPEEPWMTQLSALPEPRVAPLPLRVPANPSITAPAPPASTPQRASASRGPVADSPPKKRGATGSSSPSLPQLVGLVGAPGGAGSAIFQIGDSSVNVGVGDSIGGSGWRLRSADDESAVIERGSERRRISILAGG